MSPKGVHYIVEVSGCDNTITNVPKLQDILVEAAKRAHAQVWSVSFNKFPPNGVSGVVVISESHIHGRKSITWLSTFTPAEPTPNQCSPSITFLNRSKPAIFT